MDGVANFQSNLAPGALFAGRYKIERPLGEGGMGSVYLAEDTMFEREKVALKILHSHLSKDTRHSKRFLREVQLTRKLSHPNVVRTYDVGTSGQNLFFTMEYIEGQSLKERLAAGPLGPYEVPYILAEIAAGLQAVHDLGIIHRDLKPGNVILDPQGGVKITDFGVARNGVSDLTSTNEIVGSVTYVAPEIWLGKEATGTCDIYALGVIGYQLLTGILPFDGETPPEVMCKHLEVIPEPPQVLNTEIPQWLGDLVMRLLAKEPSARPQTAAEVRSMIDANRTSVDSAGVNHIVHKSGATNNGLGEKAQIGQEIPHSGDFFRDTFDGPPPDLKPNDTYISPSAEFAQTIAKVRAQRASDKQRLIFIGTRLALSLGFSLLVFLFCMLFVDNILQKALILFQEEFIGFLAVVAYLQLLNLSLVLCIPIMIALVLWKGLKNGIFWWLGVALGLSCIFASISFMRIERMNRLRLELRNVVMGSAGNKFVPWAPPRLRALRCRLMGGCTPEIGKEQTPAPSGGRSAAEPERSEFH